MVSEHTGYSHILLFDKAGMSPNIMLRYVGQGKVEEAKAILIKYHGDGNPDSLVVNLELEEMFEVIELEGSDKRWWDFRALFNSRAARYRTFLVTCIAWFGQLDLPPTSYYFPLMGKSLRTSQKTVRKLLADKVRRTYSKNCWNNECADAASSECHPDTNHDDRRSLRNPIYPDLRQTEIAYVLEYWNVALCCSHYRLHRKSSRASSRGRYWSCVPLRLPCCFCICLGK